MPRVLVVGAGVIGLTTALVLKDNFPEYIIDVRAKELPGDFPGPEADLGLEYASPHAGADWYSPNEMVDAADAARCMLSYHKFTELAKEPNAWVQPTDTYFGVIPGKSGKVPEFVPPWYRNKVEGYRYIGRDDVKFPGVRNLFVFKGFVISTNFYLSYLMSLLGDRGVSIRRKVISSLEDQLGEYDLVINCTGMGATSLVKDHPEEEKKRMNSVRGHTLLVENTLPYEVLFDELEPEEEGEFLMMFPRKEGGAVLGNIYDNHSPALDFSIHQDYLERLYKKAKKHLPELFLGENPSELHLFHHNVGFRPDREGGTRIERDAIDGRIIHNYGCGNSGYIESWGCADQVLRLIKPTSKL